MKTKKLKTRNSKYDECKIYILFYFHVDSGLVKSLPFHTDESTIRTIIDLQKSQNDDYKDKAYQYMIDKAEDYDHIFFSDENGYDLSTISTPELRKPFMEYSRIVLDYLCCSDTIQQFIEKDEPKPRMICISVDNRDKSKHTVTGSISCADECRLTEYQLK